MVGRVQGIVQHDANKKWGYKQARFTRFDAIDDEEVSAALFEYLDRWAAGFGMTEIVGPLGFSDFEREGLLIEGFEEPQTYEEQYNYPYYQRLIEASGYAKDTDWMEFQIYGSDEDPEKLKALGNKLMERYELTFWQAKTMSELLDGHIYDILGVVEQAYSPLYGTVPLNEETVSNYIKDFKSIVRPQDIGALFDKNGRTVAVAIVFPSISDAVRSSNGHITPGFLYRFLRDKRHPKVMDLGLIGVLPEYNSKGIIAIMIGMLVERIREAGLDYMETNLILEDNLKMQNLLKHFNKRYTKRRRCFKKQIGEVK